MKRYFIVSAFVVIVLTINLSWGKQHGRRQQQKHIDIKYVHLLEAKHSRHHHGHKKELGKVTHLSQSKPTDRQGLPGFKCRRVKFIINRNLRLKKETTDAMWRRMRAKHRKKVLHKFIRPNKRFHLPKETKLLEDTDGNLVTYIEDCVPSEQAEKQTSFASQKELIIAPAFDENKVQKDQDSSRNSGLASVRADDKAEDAIGVEGVLPAAEDSLFQTVSDSSAILKDNALKEGTAQFLNDQPYKDAAPSNFATLFEPASVDSPNPKKTAEEGEATLFGPASVDSPNPKKTAEEGEEMNRYFSSTGFPVIPPLPGSDVVMPLSNKPGSNQVPGQYIDLPAASDTGYVTSPASQEKAYTQEITPHTVENGAEDGIAHTFSEAFNKLGTAEENELEKYTGLHVPQTIGEEMKVANEEVDYEKTVENEYGKSKSIAQKG